MRNWFIIALLLVIAILLGAFVLSGWSPANLPQQAVSAIATVAPKPTLSIRHERVTVDRLSGVFVPEVAQYLGGFPTYWVVDYDTPIIGDLIDLFHREYIVIYTYCQCKSVVNVSTAKRAPFVLIDKKGNESLRTQYYLPLQPPVVRLNKNSVLKMSPDDVTLINGSKPGDFIPINGTNEIAEWLYNNPSIVDSPVDDCAVQVESTKIIAADSGPMPKLRERQHLQKVPFMQKQALVWCTYSALQEDPALKMSIIGVGKTAFKPGGDGYRFLTGLNIPQLLGQPEIEFNVVWEDEMPQ